MEGIPVKAFDGGWLLSRKCPHCGRFVKNDDEIFTNSYGIKPTENATCKKCGRVKVEVIAGGE